MAFKESLARYNRLQQKVDVLERKGLAIVEDKIAHINKLEKLENSSGGLRPNNFLFNVSSKKLVLEDNFNRLSVNFNPSVVVPDFEGITTSSSRSSQK